MVGQGDVNLRPPPLTSLISHHLLCCITGVGVIDRIKVPQTPDMEDCPLPEGALACSEVYQLEVQDDCSVLSEEHHQGLWHRQRKSQVF